MEKAKKKPMKRAATWIAAAIVVTLLTALPLLAKSAPAADGPVASVLSAQVESGSIHQVINGGGTLSANSVDVNIPEGVKITGFLVKNGDHITAGTPVAAVDKVSVLAAMSEVEDTMDYLRDEIEDARDEAVSSTIYATTGGRIKKVFAYAGESVQDVMLNHGALALLSVDGRMAVKLEVTSDIATGESVDVTMTGGSTVSGRVESNLSGEVVVSIEDDGYAIGTEVSVAGLGSGELYVHNAWKATGYSGTISYVNVREEQTVSAGTSLFSLTDTDYTGQWEHRMSQHREYEALLQRLTVMYQSGTIDAPCDGVVSGVEEDSTFLLSAETDDWNVSLLDGNESSWQLMLLSSACQQAAGCTGATHTDQCPEACNHATTAGTCPYKGTSHKTDCIDGCTMTESCPNKQGHHKNGCYQNCTGNKNCTAADHKAGCYELCNESSNPSQCPNAAYGADHHKTDCIHKCTNAEEEKGPDACKAGKNHYLSCVESCQEAQTDGASCKATNAHKDNCIYSCIEADAVGKCRTGPHKNSCIEGCTESSTCKSNKHKEKCDLYGMTFTAQAARVDSVGNIELVVFWDSTGTVYPVEQSSSGWTLKGQVDEKQMLSRGTLPLANTQDVFHKGDIVLNITGYKNGVAVYRTVAVYSAGSGGNLPGAGAGMPSMGGAGGMGGGMGGMIGGFSGNGSYSATSGEDEGLFNADGYTLMTLLPQETMTISISLDEQDINSIHLGMEATVKVEALRDREYTAVVTSIGYTGENDGGSSKFPVELTLEVDQDMLDGMSTTAQIILETRENIPVIPLAALNGDSVDCYVYTALDKETGEPTNPVNVETGSSDGENVEILSGLSVGDKVYYHYYDVLELDTSA